MLIKEFFDLVNKTFYGKKITYHNVRGENNYYRVEFSVDDISITDVYVTLQGISGINLYIADGNIVAEHGAEVPFYDYKEMANKRLPHHLSLEAEYIRTAKKDLLKQETTKNKRAELLGKLSSLTWTEYSSAPHILQLIEYFEDDERARIKFFMESMIAHTNISIDSILKEMPSTSISSYWENRIGTCINFTTEFNIFSNMPNDIKSWSKVMIGKFQTAINNAKG